MPVSGSDKNSSPPMRPSSASVSRGGRRPVDRPDDVSLGSDLSPPSSRGLMKPVLDPERARLRLQESLKRKVLLACATGRGGLYRHLKSTGANREMDFEASAGGGALSPRVYDKFKGTKTTGKAVISLHNMKSR